MDESDRAARVPKAAIAVGSALRVHEALKARPILSLPAIRGGTGLSFPAASSAMDLLVELGLARESTGKRRNRLFVYERSFEEAIECALLRHGPDACAGDATAVRETPPPYGDTPPGGYRKRQPEDFVLATQPKGWKKL